MAWTICIAALGACSAPGTELHNPSGHRTFVDGREVVAPAQEPTLPTTDPLRQPFVYYGVARWDAQPADRAKTASRSERPDWLLLPSSGRIERPAPVSAWLFPLDFPLELLLAAAGERADFRAEVTLPTVAEEERVIQGVRPAGLDRVAERARAARTTR
jgi:hypothetical protein